MLYKLLGRFFNMSEWNLVSEQIALHLPNKVHANYQCMLWSIARLGADVHKKTYQERVKNPKFTCKNYRRVASKKEYLCEPVAP